MIKNYLMLTKPGIIFGNAVTAVAGFMLASKGHVDLLLFVAMLTGLSLIIGSACVFNNYIDRGIDVKMTRTKTRALAIGAVSVAPALMFASALGCSGALILALFTNVVALWMALAGFFVYVMLYSPCKYYSSYATEIGSIAGAIPPVVGYAAVTNGLDLGALLVFLLIAFWQMPHFYAIAMYRLEDYAAASIPVLPLAKGLQRTKVQMFVYVVLFLITSCLLTTFGYTASAYLFVVTLVGMYWLVLASKGFTITNDKKWARSMFIYSLVVVMILSLMICVDSKISI